MNLVLKLYQMTYRQFATKTLAVIGIVCLLCLLNVNDLRAAGTMITEITSGDDEPVTSVQLITMVDGRIIAGELNADKT